MILLTAKMETELIEDDNRIFTSRASRDNISQASGLLGQLSGKFVGPAQYYHTII